MQHSNSKRGSDGRFGSTDAPKARRIEVWLQPQTVELLDTLTSQWGVGRGKVIDQLLTRGPVPPQSWTTVETPAEPTPSGPSAEPEPKPAPEPDPIPEPKFKVSDQVHLAGFEGEPEPLGTITECFYIDEAFASTSGIQYEPQWAYELDTDTTQAEQMLELYVCTSTAPTPSGPSAEAKSAFDAANTRDVRIQKIQERATPERLAAMQQGLNAVRFYPSDSFVNKGEPVQHPGDYFSDDIAREYFFDESLKLVDLQGPKRVTARLIDCLHSRIPSAAHIPLPKRFDAAQAVLWGAILRLGTTDIEPPTTSRQEFLSWCGFEATRKKVWDRAFETMRQAGITNPLDQKLPSASDMSVLELDPTSSLTAKSIRDAYVKLAKVHHPDQGGNAEKFHQIQAAYNRLLLTV